VRSSGSGPYRRQEGDIAAADITLMNLSTEQLALVTGLHGIQDVETLCRESSLSDFEVFQALSAFRVINVVQRVDLSSPAQLPVVDEGLDFILPEE
jgi:hypothetical protein